MRSRPRLRVAALAAVVGALLVACGGSGDNAGGGAVASRPPVGDRPEQNGGTAPATQRPLTNITFPAGGPTGPVFPPGTPAYMLLSTGRCAELLRQVGTWEARGVDPVLILLYRAAGEACLQRFDAARDTFDDLRALRPRFGNECPADENSSCERCHRLALAWVTDVVEAHRRNPDLEAAFSASSAPNPCPTTAGATNTTRPTSAASTSTTRRR